MADSFELKDENGNIFFFNRYIKSEGWIYSCWSGSVSDEQVKLGAAKNLPLIKEHKCGFILNDNRELSGNWSASNDWIEEEFLPQAADAGLKYIAHVFSPKFITKFSAVDLGVRDLPVISKTFNNLEKAQEWLREKMKFLA